jgi:hypothetical protein
MTQSSTNQPWRTAHRTHWAAAATLAALAVALELCNAVAQSGGADLAQMALFAAAAAEVAIGHQIRERGKDEPVLNAILTEIERGLRKDLDRFDGESSS